LAAGRSSVEIATLHLGFREAVDGANVSGARKNGFRQESPDALRKSKELVIEFVDSMLTVVMTCLR
jgi:hypothetical protein